MIVADKPRNSVVKWNSIDTYEKHGEYYYVDLIIEGAVLLGCYYHFTTRTWRQYGGDISILANNITHWRASVNTAI